MRSLFVQSCAQNDGGSRKAVRRVGALRGSYPPLFSTYGMLAFVGLGAGLCSSETVSCCVLITANIVRCGSC